MPANDLFPRAWPGALALAAMAALSACSLTPPPAQVAPAAPAQWQQTVPASQQAASPSEAAQRLRAWWQQLSDPLLLDLIARAQQASPDLASAKTRVSEARAAWVSAGAAGAPQLNAQASAVRSNTSAGAGPSGASAAPATVLQAALQPQWEIDLFGGLGAAQRAADRRVQAARDQWQLAQVAVAAEVANAYFNERACAQQLNVAQADAASRAQTAKLTGLSAQAGFTAPADAALARAAASDAAARARDTQAQCVLARKALVALTASDEPQLSTQLQANALRQSWPDLQAVPSVPAHLLLQRPDVHAAEHAVAAASADVGEAQAQRYPRLTLTGSIGRTVVRTAGVQVGVGTWSVGPLALSVPLMDGGARRANIQASEARYDEAVVRLHASVRQAVREVETALEQLASSRDRTTEVDTAVANYARYLRATQARHTNGMASLFELEDARRNWLAAQQTQVNLQRDQALAWVGLYRALGGGWLAPEAAMNAPAGTANGPAGATVTPTPVAQIN